MRLPRPANAGWRGNQLMIAKVLAAADDAPLTQLPASAQAQSSKQIAAQLKRERRNAKRSTGAGR